MSGITQKIPNYIGGISQQPDELIPIGSVKDAVNVIPDVTDGLRKRSGSRLVNPLLTDKQGSWFHFNYADNQKYIGKVNYDGTVQMFNAADGLPIPILYKDWEYQPTGDSGYPDCDLAALDTAKLNWVAKVKEYEAKSAELNDLVYSSNSTEETDTYFRAERDRSVLEERYFVYEGHISKNGQDIIVPESKGDGWQRRRGSIGRVDGKELSGVTVMAWVTLPDFEGWQKYYPCDVYENVFYRTTVNDNQAQIDTLRSEVASLKIEVDNLYNIYLSEAQKCGYTAEANITTRAIIDSDTSPTYLKHNLPMQIKTLIVGDTVFFTNPAVTTSMQPDSQSPTRATENYIELQTIASGKVYNLELIDEVSVGTSYTVATKVSVIDGDYQDEDSACIYQGTNREVFTDGGSKLNLDLTVTVVGNQLLEGNGNSLSDYVCKYNTNVEINNGGTNWQVGDVVKTTVTGKTIKLRVDEVETRYTSRGTLLSPPQTPTGTSTVSAQQILEDLKTTIETADPNFIVEIIGNGIYVTHSDPNYAFTFATPEGQLMSITTSEVNNIADLPEQCKGGYIVKVANTDSEFDDYYAVFETEYKGMDGPGTWVETVAPGLATVINPNSMPHKMTRGSDGSFTVSPIDWEPRLVGDNKTNPKPSFLSRPALNDLRFINRMAFFKNRLCLLSGDNVICSRPGDYYNFWKGSALSLVDNDPIDIAVGSSASSANAVLLDAIEVSDGLVVFSETEQHLLSTDSEVFGPNTARFNRIGTHRYTGSTSKRLIQPDGNAIGVTRGVDVFSLGQTIGFTSDSGLHSRVMELYNISRSTEASVNELTKPVSRLLPYGINILASSQDNNIIAVAKRNTKDVWVYRYFDNDQERQQSAWFRWTMLGDMIYHCIMDDVYWSVSIGRTSSISVPDDKKDIISLQRIDLKDELATAFVYDKYIDSEVAGDTDMRVDNGIPFQAHLDNYRIAQPSEFTYYPHIDQTYFRAPLVYYADQRLVAYMLSPTIYQRQNEHYGPGKHYYFQRIGGYVPVRVEEDNLGTWFVMDGDWSRTRMMIGYEYEMKVEFPTIFPTQSRNKGITSVVRTDTRGSLTIHRIKLNFGQTGVYETTIKRLGRDNYTELYECKTMDEYPANEVAFDQHRTQVVPVYSKNTDTKLILRSYHPSPATLNSMEWEGEYTNRYYSRV